MPVLPALPPKRLHPLTLVFTLGGAIRAVFVPALILFFFSTQGKRRTFWSILIYLVFVAFGTLYALVRYFTFSYRIVEGELIIRHGLIEHTERHIPLSRVQDIRTTQGIFHRLLRVYAVEIETAGGGQGEEASLSVLSQADVDELRAAVFSHRAAPAVLAPTLPVAAGAIPLDATGSVTPAAPPAPAPPREIIREITLRELILAGLTSNRVASGLAIVAALFFAIDDVLPKDFYEKNIELGFRALWRWLDVGGSPFWIVKALLGLFVLLFIGVAFSVAGSIVSFYGFALSRAGEDLHRSHGLFTKHASSLPRRRIQLLKIEEGFLRRLLRLATLRANTAGSVDANAEQQGLDVLLPAIHRDEVQRVLPAVFPDLTEASPSWQLVSRRYVRRATMKAVLACTLLFAAAFIFRRSFEAFWFFALLPPLYVLNVLAYQRLGYALADRFFHTRRGVFSRSTHVVPVRNVQSVVLHQSPFDRWHGVMKLTVDTAGQGPAGTGPEISNVPQAQALTTAHELAHRASRTRYRW